MISIAQRVYEILIKNNLISEIKLKEAIDLAKKRRKRLVDILIEDNLIKEKELFPVLSEGLGFPIIDLKRIKIERSVIKIISKDLAHRYQIIPVSLIGKTLTLAMSDPLDVFAIDDVKSLTGYQITPVIVSPSELNATINQYYEESAKEAIEELVEGFKDGSIELIRAEKEEVFSLATINQIINEAPVIKVANMILEKAVNMYASDILIEPLENRMRVRYRIDGVLQEQESPPKSMLAPIVSRIKVISNLNVAEHRLPQDGRFKIKIGTREVDFRVSVIASSFGEKVALRVLDKSQAQLDIEKLGFSQTALDRIKRSSQKPHGMIIVCGPTGSGKTTTLYSILEFIDTPRENIITVEDPIEFQLAGINQVNIRPEVDLTFASCLRSILRQDPDVIMVGEIRDHETADISIKAALTGHLVLTTVHTTTAPAAVMRLANIGIEPFLITSSVIAIIAQRLLRKVCVSCREEYVLSDDIMQSLNLKKIPTRKFYRAKGCAQCFNTGYKGRVAIAEVLILTPKIRDLVLEGAQEYMIKKISRDEGMLTLREEGMEKASEGITTLEEVVRITAPDE
ncbi:MAG: ATPase, T2SS/T4P/T4SS family [Candidatus Omnitrophota bacterium]